MELDNVDDPVHNSTANAPKTELAKIVQDQWTPRDVADFLLRVDCDWAAPLSDVAQHMVFRPEHTPNFLTERHGGVERPMYRIGRWYYDARRISSILFNQEDPVAMRCDLEMACGHEFCVHPRHIVLQPRRNKGSSAF